MRTRFLGIDFFSSTPFQSVETLEFLRLPPPQLPPWNASNLKDISCFAAVSALNITIEIDKFPVDQALDKFFSDVIPQNINFDLADALVSTTNSGFYEQAHNKINNVRGSGEETETTFHDRTNNNYATLQFEMPVLDLPLENACISHEQKMQIFFEVMNAEVSEDMHSTIFGLKHLVKVQESISSVDDINMEYIMEEKSIEQGGLNQTETNCSAFPLLEVDEISLGILSNTFMEGFNIIENTEPQTLMQNDDPVGDGQELLHSMESDLLQHILDHCLQITCLDTELSRANFLEMDFISVIEDGEMDEKLELPRGRQDGNFFLSMTPIKFEQFQFVDVKTSQYVELFYHVANVAESESCEDMFDETANFQNFDELIVSHQITLVDDSFKSLPVPVFPDPGNKWLPQTAIEDIIAMMKPQPSSTSDGIYLDWHLLDEAIWDNTKYGSSWKLLEDIDNYSFDSDVNSIDNKLLFEFVFSDDYSTGSNRKENMERLNIEMNTASGTICTEGCYSKVASDNLSKYRSQETVSGEVPFDIYGKKAPQSMHSISQFDDLDFFLNPLDCTHGKEQKLTSKTFNNDDSFPAASSRDSVVTGSTSKVQLQPVKLKFEELPTVVPTYGKDVGESLATADEFKAWSMPLPAQCAPAALVSEQTCASTPSSPDAIIIVNTQNVDGEMIISRRSTYQKILSMEKEGAQVVERDLNLPVDVVLSAAICLVWYDSRNIRKKATASDEAASLLSSCVENIAANVLTSISFTFIGCILVFEGDVSFLSGIMELSDELYAAAASLGIELQLFCSYSSELTDEIILSCIRHAKKLVRGLYPKMCESETLAESFLTKIPSVNPLSAHSILSSVRMLLEFFEWSHRHRSHALQRYPISDESINLLSAFCRYGERDDSKSGMTDCSSSVSSAADSGNIYGKSEFEKRKRKCTGNPDRIAMSPVELFQIEESKQCSNELLKHPQAFKQCPSCMSKDLEISDNLGKSSIAFDNALFANKQGSDISMMTNSARLSNSCDFEMSKLLEISPKLENSSFLVNQLFFGRSRGLHMPMNSELDWPSNDNCGSLQKDFIGEVVDIDDCSAEGQDSPTSFSHLATKTGKENITGAFCSARNLSFGAHSHPTFPSAAEISSGSASWSSERDSRQNSREGIHDHSEMDLNNKNTPLKVRNMFLKEGIMLNSAANISRPSFQEDGSHYRRTPLSNAIVSSQAQEGSPWTIEFLNRIREKSRLRQKALPHDLSGPCFGYSGNIAKVTKRKSPSILDFYKYQMGSTASQPIEHKRQKQPLQPSSSSKIEKGSLSSLPKRTPADKRVKRRLSFANNGSQGQTKLVWIDKTAQTPNKIF